MIYLVLAKVSINHHVKILNKYVLVLFKKFQAFIASAVVNTEEDDKNTYLFLGPIGMGAFANEPRNIE